MLRKTVTTGVCIPTSLPPTTAVALGLATAAVRAGTLHTTGFDVNTIGVILMIIGLVGIVISLFFWSSWGGFHNRRTVVVDRQPRRMVEDDVPRRVVESDVPRRRIIEET